MTNNELIADFIGFQKTNLGWFDNEETMNFKSDGNTYDSYELKFHSSWDWLMPVVDKCFDIHLEHSDDLSFLLNDALLTTNIDEVYKAVMEFIKRTKKST